LERDRGWRDDETRLEGPSAALRVRGGMEEVRAALGHGAAGQTPRDDASGARAGAERAESDARPGDAPGRRTWRGGADAADRGPARTRDVRFMCVLLGVRDVASPCPMQPAAAARPRPMGGSPSSCFTV